jgi:hypothetical protein
LRFLIDRCAGRRLASWLIIRLPNVRVAERIALMSELLSGRLKDEIRGAVVTVEIGRVHISRPGT